MPIKNLHILFFLWLTQAIFAQTTSEKLLVGKIVSENLAVEKVNVLNDTSGKATVTNEQGFFTIPVKVGDALVFSAVNLETKRKVIHEEDLVTEQILIKMSVKMTPLKEVKVNENSNITAENLGIIPHGQKKYTPAERRFNEATTGGGLVPLNPILNAISGRTTMLKKEIQVEKKERLLLQLDGWFEEDFYVNSLKIPADYIKGFHYFLIEDTDFVRALKVKNKTLTKFLIKGLALKFKDTLSVEQK
ncbi:hypothetical protein [Flavobacterium sp.]|uniref:hypothetical protein n=1 Tax=Flavobacterium sp. TaxID=239 RepID=UPI002634F429|nr:hypothetical protein [Flavobacterium sp.]